MGEEGSHLVTLTMKPLFRILFYLCILAASSPLTQPLHSVTDSLQEFHEGSKGTNKNGTIGQRGNTRNDIIHNTTNKMEWRGGGTPTGQNGNNGHSGGSSPTHHGVYPQYAGRSTNNRHHKKGHRRKGSGTRHGMTLTAIIATTSASLLMQLYMLFGLMA